MPATDSQPDLPALEAWQGELARRATSLREQVAKIQAELASVEERHALVTKLIEVEVAGTSEAGSTERTRALAPDEPDAPPLVPTPSVEDSVEQILRSAGRPLHISEIRERLLAEGMSIPGRGDEANIIVRLRRLEDRFTRTARGTYGLAEWGLPPVKSATTRRRRAASS
jgi:HB1, ASXL, restriction endonuclease HTH domain